MRILIISQYWAPENGVPQRRWSWITDILTQAGHSVTVLAPPPHYDRQIGFSEWWKNGLYRTRSEREFNDQNCEIVRTGFIPSGKSLTQRILNQAAVASAAIVAVLKYSVTFNGDRPDVIIGTVPALPTAVVAYIASRRFKVPYIIDLRDAWPDLIQESGRWNISIGTRSLREKIFSKGPLQALGFITTKAIDFCLKRAAGIIVTSSRLGAELQLRHRNVAKVKGQVIGTVRNVFPPEVAGMKETRNETPPLTLNVLYAGTLGRAQNLPNAIEAAELATRAGYQVNLRLVGAGAAKTQLAIESQGRMAHIEISSKIAPEDLDAHYRWADTALVHLTDWRALSQAVPSKTYELMSMGIHISAVVAGETADLVDELSAGDVVTPEDPKALAALWIELMEDRAKLAVNGSAANWVKEQRERIAPLEILRIIESIEKRS